jgi:hypothetical protein
MSRSVDYRSALIMAAALGGSAVAQSAPAREHPQHYLAGAGGAAYRRSVAAPYLAPHSAAPVASAQDPPRL